MAGRLTDGIVRWAGIAAVGAFAACGGGGGDSDDDTDVDVPGVQDECEDPVFVDLGITGEVTDGGAPAAAGVAVRIEERTFAPGSVHGEGVTDGDGRFSIAATELPIVDGCLGFAMGFFVVADDGTRTAEWGINSVISGAWSRGESSADLSAIPLDLQD